MTLLRISCLPPARSARRRLLLALPFCGVAALREPVPFPSRPLFALLRLCVRSVSLGLLREIRVVSALA
jgi:hypothetical protein